MTARPLTFSGLGMAVLVATAAATATPPDDAGIFLDGALNDWPAGRVAMADGAHLFLRMQMKEAFTLQGGTYTTRVRLDLDGRSSTGKRDKGAEGEDALGVDLEIVMSPPSPEPGKGIRGGMSVLAYDDLGLATDVGHAPLDLSFAPSYAASEYELRMARETSLAEPVGSRWRRSERVRGEVVVVDAAGKARQPTQRFDVSLPPISAAPLATTDIPAKFDGAVRVVSWNVEWEHPVQNPPPFSRILTALDPDVLLIQEWKSTPAALAAWFSANVPSSTPWRAHTLDDLGVSVVSRHPLTPLNDAPIMPSRRVGDRDSRPIRFVSARVDSPIGELFASSVHLKCCGAMGTWEDELRQVEASSVNEFLRKRLVKRPDALCVITGDLNLVGTDLPLARLRDDLDRDGSDLDVVPAAVLGDAANYTWTHDKSRYPPGRLDFAVISDAACAVRQAFVFDAARLADDTLKRHHVQRDDSTATDHRPLVFDLVRATQSQ